MPKIFCILRDRDRQLLSSDGKELSRPYSADDHDKKATIQQLSSVDEEKHRKLLAENEQLKTLIAERELRVNELIEKLKERGSSIVVRDVQRFSGSVGLDHVPFIHDKDPTETTDTNAYVMRRRSTLVNPITLSTRISNPVVSTTTTTSLADKTIEVLSEANHMKLSPTTSYRESIC